METAGTGASVPSGATEFADPETGSVSDLIDVERYPIHDPTSSAAVSLVDQVRAELADLGCATLTGFLTPEGLRTASAEIAEAATHVPILAHEGTVYARTDLERHLPDDDPRRIRLTRLAGHVTRDMLPPYSPLQRLYVSPVFKAFIASIVGRERIYEYADPLAGLVATILPPGGRYSWHYDTNEFVVTIMMQRPEGGGAFEYHQDLRSPGDENLAGLGAVLRGASDDEARTIEMHPGDLQLFLGRYSLHRVTEITGTVARHVAVLSYAERPGVIGPLDRTRSVYGRVTEAHLVAEQARLAVNDGLIL